MGDRMSTITSKESFKEAITEAGFQLVADVGEGGMCVEDKFTFRKYAGAPLVANDGRTCVPLTFGGKSVCDKVKVRHHRPLCYCQPIPVDCEWGDWIRGTCSQTCGGGIREDLRFLKTRAAFGGDECEGSPIRQETCNMQNCPVDCEWGEWSSGKCSQTCGGGIQEKTRVPRVFAKYDGKDCDGEKTKRKYYTRTNKSNRIRRGRVQEQRFLAEIQRSRSQGNSYKGRQDEWLFFLRKIPRALWII